MRNRQYLALAAAVMVTVPGLSMATNGYFSHGYGTKSKGLAGGGSALPQDSLAAANNPAGMVWVGDRTDLGASLFAPYREYTADSGAFNVKGGNWGSDNNLFLIPSFGWNQMLDDNSSMGVSVYANGGMNTEYSNDSSGGIRGVYNDGTAGVDLKQLFVNLSYARKINERASYGASLILAAQAFEAKGLGSFAGLTHAVNTGSTATDLSDNGHDMSYGAGLKFGIQGEVANGLTLAGSFQTKTWMSKFDDYKDLFAENGDFDIPASATIGLAWNPVQNHTFTFDIQHIMYEGVDSVSNPMANLLAPGCPNGGGTDVESCLGGDNGAGFGWDNMTVYKLGYQWEPNNLWTVRLGYSHSKQPINADDVTFNIIAPAVIEEHYTVGLTRKIGQDQEISLAGMYAPRKSIDGTNPFSGGVQNVDIEMHQYEVEVSWSWLF
ncbi:MAG: hypothetical protein GY814_06535 [Gammaproteobacteria bacterium]|nr:hypothetical protein [Gammaproteobacteria bacterium]